MGEAQKRSPDEQIRLAREQFAELRGEVDRVPARKTGQVPVLGRILGLEALRDLGQA